MLVTVKLNDNFGSGTIEVNDIRPDSLLAPESHTCNLLVPKDGPQPPLRVGCLGAQPLGKAMLRNDIAQQWGVSLLREPLPEICLADFDPPSRGG